MLTVLSKEEADRRSVQANKDDAEMLLAGDRCDSSRLGGGPAQEGAV